MKREEQEEALRDEARRRALASSGSPGPSGGTPESKFGRVVKRVLPVSTPKSKALFLNIGSLSIIVEFKGNRLSDLEDLYIKTFGMIKYRNFLKKRNANG